MVNVSVHPVVHPTLNAKGCENSVSARLKLLSVVST
ncbi:hypothetical protein MGSAQ_002460 [marine sediment metagenome]|uniref:Uncharacterized protein n=1 Tax=marine sediment metagenome TaxID=412755 RepID=A0A1B6NRU9_9ZZZZ